MWRRASSSTHRAFWIGTSVGVPLLWLAMLEGGYLLSHWSCGTGITWPHFALTAGIALLLAAVLWTIPAPGGALRERSSSAFLATISLWLTAGFLLVVIASAVPAAIPNPCD